MVVLKHAESVVIKIFTNLQVRIMKLINALMIGFLCLFTTTSCIFNDAKTGSLKEAEQHFIDKVQYMTEREAMAHEISYYKAPDIKVKRKVRDLTGKDAVHECNLLLEENRKESEAAKTRPIKIAHVWFCDKEKNYALDHINDIVGAEYYFEGVFTHWNNGYETRRAKVLCINGSWYVIQQYK